MSDLTPSAETSLSTDELKFIQDAAEYLENPSFLMRLADMFGKPLEWLIQGIEKISPDVVDKSANAALKAALSVAIATIPESPGRESHESTNIAAIGASPDFWHKVSVAVTGTAGGFFGLPGLCVELPITTAIMFRSIASIASEFGEQLSDDQVRMQCLAVFSLGGPAKPEDAMGSSYLSARLGLEQLVSAAAKAVAGKTAEEIASMVQKGTAAAVVNLIARIAARFDVIVTEKVVVESLPVIGAVTGGTINIAFMDHFNRVARFHFGMRKLERKYGVDRVQSLYKEEVRKEKQSGSIRPLLEDNRSPQSRP
jgi:hypothetical protein